MQAILPILICSTISAALGYYFGHITVPSDPSADNSLEIIATASDKSGTARRDSAQSDDPSLENSSTPSLNLVEEETAETEAEPLEAMVATNSTAMPSEKDFAKRADKTIVTLTDTQGRTINASILKVLDTGVEIRRSDGLETTIPLNMLIEEDIDFCNYLREQQKLKEPTTPDTLDEVDWESFFDS